MIHDKKYCVGEESGKEDVSFEKPEDEGHAE